MASADFCTRRFSSALARASVPAKTASRFAVHSLECPPDIHPAGSLIHPGKNTSFRSIAAASTAQGLLPTGFGTLCCLTLPAQPLIRFLFVRTDLCSPCLLQTRSHLRRPPNVSGQALRLANWLPPAAVAFGGGLGNSPVEDFHLLVFRLPFKYGMYICLGKPMCPFWAHTTDVRKCLPCVGTFAHPPVTYKNIWNKIPRL